MIYILYNCLLYLLLPVIVGYHLYRSVSRGRKSAFRERFGYVSDETLKVLEGEEVVWVHAVSVGETIAVKPLLKALRLRFPNRKIVLSNVTETGRSIAETLPEADACLYFPFDYGFACRRLLRTINPSLIIIVETEIWPNFLRTASELAIPTVMVNGRISDRSFVRYLKLRWFFRPVLTNLSALCMQSAEDARRIVAIGADSDRVHVTRNLKYDIPFVGLTANQKAELRQKYRIPAEVTVIAAGSTHAGEEELVLNAFRQMQATGHECLMVLVPRHPERAGQVAELLRGSGYSFTLRSQLVSKASSFSFSAGEVLLVDTIGELMDFYSVSDIAFVGGSLVPTGGHNILEPASRGVPVLFGPHTSNFREIVSLVLASGAGVQVNDEAELADILTILLTDHQQRISMGEKGALLLAETSGATELHLEVIASLVS